MGAVLLLSNSCQHLHINVLVQFVLGYVCLSALATARLGSRCCDDLTENDSVQMSSRASGRPVCLELGSRCCADLTESDSVQMSSQASGRPVCLELGSRCCDDLTENDSVQMQAQAGAFEVGCSTFVCEH